MLEAVASIESNFSLGPINLRVVCLQPEYPEDSPKHRKPDDIKTKEFPVISSSQDRDGLLNKES